MTLPKLMVTPNQAGYSLQDGDSVLRAKVSAGRARLRLNFLGAPSTVDVSWSLGPSEYQYFRSFLRSTLMEGSLPFLIDLIIDDAVLTEHEATFIPGSVRMSGVRGLQQTVQAQLEIMPLDTDADVADALVMLFEAYGSDADSVLNQLEQTVNFDMAVLA